MFRHPEDDTTLLLASLFSSVGTKVQLCPKCLDTLRTKRPYVQQVSPRVWAPSTGKQASAKISPPSPLSDVEAIKEIKPSSPSRRDLLNVRSMRPEELSPPSPSSDVDVEAR